MQSDAWNALVGPGGLSKDVVASDQCRSDADAGRARADRETEAAAHHRPRRPRPISFRKRMADEESAVGRGDQGARRKSGSIGSTSLPFYGRGRRACAGG